MSRHTIGEDLYMQPSSLAHFSHGMPTETMAAESCSRCGGKTRGRTVSSSVGARWAGRPERADGDEERTGVANDLLYSVEKWPSSRLRVGSGSAWEGAAKAERVLATSEPAVAARRAVAALDHSLPPGAGMMVPSAHTREPTAYCLRGSPTFGRGTSLCGACFCAGLNGRLTARDPPIIA